MAMKARIHIRVACDAMTPTIAPLLGGLFLILGVGVLLRARFGMGTKESDTLNTLIMDVTMPALIVTTMAKRDLDLHVGTALAASLFALVGAGAIGFVLARVAGGARRAQGAGMLVVAFCNTGFLGFPLLLALFPGNGLAASTAIIVDTVDTTLVLWTFGLAIAQR